MPELPSHDDTGPGDPDAAVSPVARRRRLLAVLAVVAVALIVVVLHLTGVIGAEGHQ